MMDRPERGEGKMRRENLFSALFLVISKFSHGERKNSDKESHIRQK